MEADDDFVPPKVQPEDEEEEDEAGGPLVPMMPEHQEEGEHSKRPRVNLLKHTGDTYLCKVEITGGGVRPTLRVLATLDGGAQTNVLSTMLRDKLRLGEYAVERIHLGGKSKVEGYGGSDVGVEEVLCLPITVGPATTTQYFYVTQCDDPSFVLGTPAICDLKLVQRLHESAAEIDGVRIQLQRSKVPVFRLTYGSYDDLELDSKTDPFPTPLALDTKGPGHPLGRKRGRRIYDDDHNDSPREAGATAKTCVAALLHTPRVHTIRVPIPKLHVSQDPYLTLIMDVYKHAEELHDTARVAKVHASLDADAEALRARGMERGDYEDIPQEQKRGKVSETFTEADLKMGSGADEDDRRMCAELMREYQDLYTNTKVGAAKIDPIKLELTGDPHRTLTAKAKQWPPKIQQEVDNQLEDLHKAGAITPGSGEFACGLVLQRKPSGELRLCCDFRRLNTIIRTDHYPLPSLKSLVHSLRGASWFVSLDMKSGYFQLPIHEESQKYLQVISASGVWAWRVLPFGLSLAPGQFQRSLEQVFQDLLYTHGLLIYLDDLVIFGETKTQVMERLRRVLDRMRSYNLYLNLRKCVFMASRMRYLGMMVSRHGIEVDDRKILALKNLGMPDSVRAVRRWLGLSSYMRAFVPGFSTRVHSITALLRKRGPFTLTDEARALQSNPPGFPCVFR